MNANAMIVVNDLDSLVYRIEALGAHPQYTDALNAVQKARDSVKAAAIDLHQRDMRERFAKMDAA